MINKPLHLLLTLCCMLLTAACSNSNGNATGQKTESLQAKAQLQGIWVDEETEEVTFRAKGDTIYYPDSVSQPAYFMIADDSLYIGNYHYPIIKQATHLFWFRNQAGDLVKLIKSDDPNDVLDFTDRQPQILTALKEAVKTDSVVFLNGERYHWYIAVNPTKYRVSVSTFNDDGVSVENIYYDNIIHISVFKGAKRIFSNDFKKQMFTSHVPESFIGQAILGNMTFDRIDAQGLHFNATLCIPDAASCYMVSNGISFDGKLSMELLE
jgi:hypothetical protein